MKFFFLFLFSWQLFASDFYQQHFSLVFKSRTQAKKFFEQGSLEFLPLWGGKDWAFGTRFDDNEGHSNFKLKPLFDRRGLKVTWYLNAPDNYLPEWAGEKLLYGGHDIAGHGLYHFNMAFAPADASFWNVARVRPVWEALTARPMNSFAYPFAQYPEDLNSALEDFIRSGYLHDPWQDSPFIKINSPLVFSHLLTPDGSDMRPEFLRLMGNPYLQKLHPMMSVSLHSYAFVEEKENKLLQDFLDFILQQKNFWYCHHREYAAYRYQFKHAKIVERKLSKNQINYVLERPHLWDLGDPVPLGFSLKGPAQGLHKIVAQGEVDWPLFGNEKQFHLGHDHSYQLPSHITFSMVPAFFLGGELNVVLAGQKVLLRAFEGEFSLTNLTQETLEEVRLILRTSAAVTTVLASQRVPSLGPQQKIQLSPQWKVRSTQEAPQYQLLQVDLRFQGKSERLWLDNSRI